MKGSPARKGRPTLTVMIKRALEEAGYHDRFVSNTEIIAAWLDELPDMIARFTAAELALDYLYAQGLVEHPSSPAQGLRDYLNELRAQSASADTPGRAQERQREAARVWAKEVASC